MYNCCFDGWRSEDRGFFAGLWGGLSVGDADFNLPQHRHDLLGFVPLDDPLFLQVDSLSFHLVQISPVRAVFARMEENERRAARAARSGSEGRKSRPLWAGPNS